jgi:hypothetical protein
MWKIIALNLIIPFIYLFFYIGLEMDKLTINQRLLFRDDLFILIGLPIAIVIACFLIWKSRNYRISIVLALVVFLFFINMTIGEFNPY